MTTHNYDLEDISNRIAAGEKLAQIAADYLVSAAELRQWLRDNEPAEKPETAEERAPRELTPRQNRFVDEYIIDLNARQAAIRAGYGAAGAHVHACRMLSDANIQAAVEERQRLRAERTNITADRVLLEVARLAMFDARKLVNDDGSPRGLHTLDNDTAAAVVGVEVVEQYSGSGADRVFTGYLKKYKIADKNAALDKLMRHLGIFEKDNSQRVTPLTDEQVDAKLQRLLAKGRSA